LQTGRRSDEQGYLRPSQHIKSLWDGNCEDLNSPFRKWYKYLDLFSLGSSNNTKINNYEIQMVRNAKIIRDAAIKELKKYKKYQK